MATIAVPGAPNIHESADHASGAFSGIAARAGAFKDMATGAEFKLWAAVVQRAVEDTGCNKETAQRALAWLIDEGAEVGSFGWIVSTVLGVEVGAMRAGVMGRVEAMHPDLKLPPPRRRLQQLPKPENAIPAAPPTDSLQDNGLQLETVEIGFPVGAKRLEAIVRQHVHGPLYPHLGL
jgi:hypothetical protein